MYLIAYSLFRRVFNFQVFYQYQERNGIHWLPLMRDENIAVLYLLTQISVYFHII